MNAGGGPRTGGERLFRTFTDTSRPQSLVDENDHERRLVYDHLNRPVSIPRTPMAPRRTSGYVSHTNRLLTVRRTRHGEAGGHFPVLLERTFADETGSGGVRKHVLLMTRRTAFGSDNRRDRAIADGLAGARARQAGGGRRRSAQAGPAAVGAGQVSRRTLAYWKIKRKTASRVLRSQRNLHDHDSGSCCYQNARTDAGRAPKTINGELSVLRQVLRHARLWYRFEEDYRALRNTKPPVGQALTDESSSAVRGRAVADRVDVRVRGRSARLLLRPARVRDQRAAVETRRLDARPHRKSVARRRRPAGAIRA